MTTSTDNAWIEQPANSAEAQASTEDNITGSPLNALIGEAVTEPPDAKPDIFITAPIPDGAAFSAMVQAVMLKDMRSWAWWLVGFGVLNLFLAGINGIGWAGLLLTVGVASFLFKNAVMYVLYTITLAWAGISNLISGQTGWIFFSLLQFYMAYQTFRSYRRFQKYQNGITRTLVIEAASGKRTWFIAPNVFPWLGGLLGIGSLGGLALSFGIPVAISLIGAWEPPDTLLLLAWQFVVNAAVLGVAVSLGALLSRYRYKAASVFGLVSSSLVLIIWLLLIVFI